MRFTIVSSEFLSFRQSSATSAATAVAMLLVGSCCASSRSPCGVTQSTTDRLSRCEGLRATSDLSTRALTICVAVARVEAR